MRELTGLVRIGAESVFAVRRCWYRLRYRRLRVGRGVRFVGRLRLRQGTELVLGDRTRVRGHVIVNGGGRVEVGADSLLNGCWIVSGELVELGEGCLVSDCGITDSDYHNADPRLRHTPALAATRSPVHVGRNVWLGAHALVLKGVRIGDDSLVGAGSVVRHDVPPGVVVTGNPAQVTGTFR